jgi:hypothetical protein
MSAKLDTLRGSFIFVFVSQFSFTLKEINYNWLFDLIREKNIKTLNY